MKSTLMFLCILSVGVIAGLFFSWSVSVMPGLRKLSDKEFVSSMQSMNKAILNPLFFSFFFGALVLLLITAINSHQKSYGIDNYLLLASALTYLFGVIGITMFGNVPLNNLLENFDLANATDDAVGKIRLAFEDKWNYLNNLRTILSISAFILLIIRLLLPTK